MRPLSILPALLLAGVLAGCSAHVQSTSGTDYLARYAQYDAMDAASDQSETDAAVREIAAIEPQLQFPARIGLARIGDYGRLATVPGPELEIWAKLAEDIGPEIGEFVPISPMIAAMVSDVGNSGSNKTSAVINHIRKGAARQHVDYVLVYETATRREDKSNAISVADLTIVGMFVLPTRSVDVEATASGILLDVRNGYPYATLTAHAEKRSITRAINTGSTKRELAASAEERAVYELAEDVRDAMDVLVAEAAKPAPEN